MDITSLFKASVKTVRLKSSTNIGHTRSKTRILTKRPDYELPAKAKKIRYQITQLKNLLVENRAAYMQFAYHLKNAVNMTDEERDVIDRESENIIRMCTAMLNDFKVECKKSRLTKQMSEFMELVVDTLSSYMNAVHSIANEQRQFRMRRELETYRYFKLNSDKKAVPLIPRKTEQVSNGKEADKKLDNGQILNNGVTGEHDDSTMYSSVQAISQDEEAANSAFLEDESDLSPEDIQIFESENIQLYNELKGLSEEVEQIEKNVVDISQLQEIFTKKISLQKTDIERIANTVVGATENVKDANEQIKQAIQRNAGLRVWVLFFLIVMSLTLLFLDWYND